MTLHPAHWSLRLESCPRRLYPDVAEIVKGRWQMPIDIAKLEMKENDP